jgi:hypothetical protein
LQFGSSNSGGWMRVLMALQVLEDCLMCSDFEMFGSKGFFQTSPPASASFYQIRLYDDKLVEFKPVRRRGIQINGYELQPNVSSMRMIQLRGLPRTKLTVQVFRDFLRKTVNFIREEKTRQFIAGKIQFPGWCMPWEVRGTACIPVIAWCRHVQPIPDSDL